MSGVASLEFQQPRMIGSQRLAHRVRRRLIVRRGEIAVAPTEPGGGSLLRGVLRGGGVGSSARLAVATEQLLEATAPNQLEIDASESPVDSCRKLLPSLPGRC